MIVALFLTQYLASRGELRRSEQSDINLFSIMRSYHRVRRIGTVKGGQRRFRWATGVRLRFFVQSLLLENPLKCMTYSTFLPCVSSHISRQMPFTDVQAAVNRKQLICLHPSLRPWRSNNYKIIKCHMCILCHSPRGVCKDSLGIETR